MDSAQFRRSALRKIEEEKVLRLKRTIRTLSRALSIKVYSLRKVNKLEEDLKEFDEEAAERAKL